MNSTEPFIALSTDGGGIRGLYAAEFLRQLAKRFEIADEEVHKCFNLFAGTSTGGILAAGLAAGESPSRLASLYRDKGARIFSGRPQPVGKLQKLWWGIRHRNRPIHQSHVLREELQTVFGNQTLEDIYKKHGAALCVTAVNTLDHSPRVFKTPHLDFTRDKGISAVDACLATSAAPIYLPLHRPSTASEPSPNVYVDGGLWMNNPTPVAILEALKMADPTQPIFMLSIGNPTPTSGSNPNKIDVQRGLLDWELGRGPLELCMDSQSKAADFTSQKLVEELRRMGRKISIVRPTISTPSAKQAQDLSLDNASDEALKLLLSLAETDATECFRNVQMSTEDGRVLKAIFTKTK